MTLQFADLNRNDYFFILGSVFWIWVSGPLSLFLNEGAALRGVFRLLVRV